MTLTSRLQDFVTAVGVDVKRLTPSISPVFSYSAGTLTQITYPDGSVKTLSYQSGQLTQIVHVHKGVTTRKDFNYENGALISITEVPL